MTSASVHYDRITTRLAELDRIRGVLAAAAERVDEGWVQGSWRADGRVCLVTSIRGRATGQLRARTLDLAWHAIHDDSDGVGHVAPPQVRLARLRDLTRWNDRTGRTAAEVVALLATADRLATAEMGRLRVELGLSSPRAGSPIPRAAGWPASPS